MRDVKAYSDKEENENPGKTSGSVANICSCDIDARTCPLDGSRAEQGRTETEEGWDPASRRRPKHSLGTCRGAVTGSGQWQGVATSVVPGLKHVGNCAGSYRVSISADRHVASQVHEH